MYTKRGLYNSMLIILLILSIASIPVLSNAAAEVGTYTEISSEKLSNELFQPQITEILYKDVKGHWAENYMSGLSDMEILKGFVDNTMKPNKTITRSEFITMIARVMDLQKDSDKYSNYTDIPATHWSYTYINNAKAYGLLDDFTGTKLYPDKVITREEMAVIISGTLPSDYKVDKPMSFSDIRADYVNKISIDRISSAGIINGLPDGTFSPKGSATRAEAAAMIYRLIHLKSETEESGIYDFVQKYETSLIEAANEADIELPGALEYSIGKEKALNQKRREVISNLKKTNTNVRRSISEMKVYVLQSSLYKYVLEIDYVLSVESGVFNKSEYNIRKNLSVTKRDGHLVVFDSLLDGSLISKSKDDEKVNLTWQYVYSKTPDMTGEKKIAGLNVVSPTWFVLQNESGAIIDKGDINYTKWAHENGYKVWPLFGNAFDPDLTGKILEDADKRSKLADSIIEYSIKYNADGINMDFENMRTSDRDNYTLFIKELSAKAKAKGLITSVDVTTINQYSSWSTCYDRKALAKYADYMILMAYDQHWEGSPVSGSVAQLSWVESSLKKVLEEIPQNKLILAVPFYTRLWKEAYVDGKTVVTSQAISMETGEKVIKDNQASKIWDEKSGQYYAEFKKDGALYKIWLEDENSIRLKAQLANKYNLGGVASWRKGFEKPVVWEVIHSVLKAAASSYS
ncbi:S-layer homology domain-containing protein [Lutispora saccharofermentans]|mgnify:CR=1 FL=1|uniref:S-layer homology domain-containing protein n=1 Tax=Lutispora saccharofermentans TaxID=3024236 RepID=A0ABT1NHU3_9FIRM|nr:S-layer homology domain-containing protein [Lutispora saccharofermentans]MCQ1530815.1 S-layer homology domain-containing protein [Lutispora saccharofermentans]